MYKLIILENFKKIDWLGSFMKIILFWSKKIWFWLVDIKKDDE